MLVEKICQKQVRQILSMAVLSAKNTIKALSETRQTIGQAWMTAKNAKAD